MIVETFFEQTPDFCWFFYLCGNFLKDDVNLEFIRDKECWFVVLFFFYLGQNYSVEMLVSSHRLFKQILKYPHLITQFVMNFLTSQSRMRFIHFFTRNHFMPKQKWKLLFFSETFQVEVGGDNL